MDTAERLLREARNALTDLESKELINRIDAHLSSSESKESAVRPATMAGDRWPGDPLPPAPTVPEEPPGVDLVVANIATLRARCGQWWEYALALRFLLAQREERIKQLEQAERERDLLGIVVRTGYSPPKGSIKDDLTYRSAMRALELYKRAEAAERKLQEKK